MSFAMLLVSRNPLFLSVDRLCGIFYCSYWIGFVMRIWSFTVENAQYKKSIIIYCYFSLELGMGNNTVHRFSASWKRVIIRKNFFLTKNKSNFCHILEFYV